MDFIPVSKIDDRELPVPSAWRPALKVLADVIVLKKQPRPTKGVEIGRIENDIAKISRCNIDAYPDKLGPLCEESWKSSICVWGDGYWEVLVDLTTESGDVSDLVLHAKVIERVDDYLIETGLIYVP